MSKSLIFMTVFITAGVILIVASLLDPSSIPTVLNVFNNQKKYTITVGDAPISVELANTSAKRMKGLSGRELLPPNEGLLFVFEKPENHSFWMRDMQFPIDIIWINEKFFVVDVTENISPASFPEVFEPVEAIKFVLEVNAGWVARNSIKRGAIVKDLRSFQVL
ncbi:MAG: DUF192 domain-containing protein [bacterium]|nr:DUF192 domain-containing protein [bacterium]